MSNGFIRVLEDIGGETRATLIGLAHVKEITIDGNMATFVYKFGAKKRRYMAVAITPDLAADLRSLGALPEDFKHA